MKIFLLSMMMAVAVCGSSQKTTITVSAENRFVNASPGDENNEKVLVLQRSAASQTDHLIAKVSNEELAEGWNRHLIIYDNEDKEIIKLDSMKKDCYGVPLKTLLSAIQQGGKYSLYTTIIPQDPQKAMEVRIARQLVCKIQVSD